MTVTITASVSKVLTPNDVGTTGSHQAGIAVPKQDAMMAFFPPLDVTQYNPRESLLFRETVGIDEWALNFIYYNGKLHARSTRNEYRLTGLIPYFKKHGASVGDIVHLGRTLTGRWTISLDRAPEHSGGEASIARRLGETDDPSHVFETVRLSGTWSAVSRRSK